MAELIQHLLILAAAIAAGLYLARGLRRHLTNRGGCGCDSKGGCSRIEAMLNDAARKPRK